MTAIDEAVARIQQINDAAQKIAVGAANMLSARDEPEPADAMRVIEGFTTMLLGATVALSEIALHVGTLANQANRDFEAAVKAEAASLAEAKVAEQSKRSFIGQPK